MLVDTKSFKEKITAARMSVRINSHKNRLLLDMFFMLMQSYVTDRGFFWVGGRIRIMKYLVIFGFLTNSNAFESPFWTWILVSHLSRGCLPVPLDYVKCRQYFR